jgi:hypothetical protein
MHTRHAHSMPAPIAVAAFMNRARLALRVAGDEARHAQARLARRARRPRASGPRPLSPRRPSSPRHCRKGAAGALERGPLVVTRRPTSRRIGSASSTNCARARSDLPLTGSEASGTWLRTNNVLAS